LPPELLLRSWTVDDATAVAHWRYPGQWSVYSSSDTRAASDEYRAVVSTDDGELIGFYCVGREARVPGLAPDDTVVDIGVGMNPEWVGRGHGAEFMSAVLVGIRRDHPGTPLRAVVQSWNLRALGLARRLGFVATGTHSCLQDGRAVEYSLLQWPAT
jgi:[ribosomal protein S18]-alanine N-acetyltransferase